MSRDNDLSTWPASRSTRQPSRLMVPVLIQVPAIPSSTRSTRARFVPQFPTPGRIVAAGSVAKCEWRATHYSWPARCCWLRSCFGEAGPPCRWPRARTPEAEARDCDAKDLAAASRPPTISLSIEPSALTPIVEVESPVVLPGYLLPDDGCEDTHHAGS